MSGQSKRWEGGSSLRGMCKTDSLIRKVNRAMDIFQTHSPDHQSTTYTRLAESLHTAVKEGESHLLGHSEDVDENFENDLDVALLEARDALTTGDELADALDRTRDEEIRQKRAISHSLPKARPGKWNCEIDTFPRFKQTVAQIIIDYPTPHASRNAFLELVESKTLRDELAAFPTAQAAIDSLELRFGNPCLSGPHLITQLKQIPEARNDREEMNNLARIRELRAQLREIQCEGLVTHSVVFNILHSLTPVTGKDMMGKLSLDKNLSSEETRIQLWRLLDQQYVTNTM